jgi:hypothetical protein
MQAADQMEQALSAPVPEKDVRTAEPRAPARLSGRWARLVRAAWVIAAALAVFVFVASLPAAPKAIEQGIIGQSHQGKLANNPDATPTTLDIAITMLSIGVALGSSLVSLILAVVIFWHGRGAHGGLRVLLSVVEQDRQKCPLELMDTTSRDGF